MALINCPECNKQISDFAVNCPNCGYPLQKQNFETKSTPQNRNISQNKASLPPALPKPVGCFKIVLIVVASVFGLFVLMGILAGIFSTESNEIKTIGNTEKVTDSIVLNNEQKNDTIINSFATTSPNFTHKQSEVTKTKETTVKKSSPVRKTKAKRKPKSSRTYYTGPRGGCYYINSNGNKTYVDRSFCN